MSRLADTLLATLNPFIRSNSHHRASFITLAVSLPVGKNARLTGTDYMSDIQLFTHHTNGQTVL